MNSLNTLRTYLNFAVSLRGFLKNSLSLEDIKASILEQSANREENFLINLKNNVFEYPNSPYLPLFNASHLTYLDVKKMVIQQGLEDTLGELYSAGVYITFEEFKGRVPIIRGNLEYSPKDNDFDNPNLNPILFGYSGGSTGQATRTKLDLDHITQITKHFALGFATHDLFDIPMMVWAGILPDYNGVSSILWRTHMGHKIHRWFSPINGKDINFGGYYTLLTYLIVLIGRIYGVKFPIPEHVPLDKPLPIAEKLAETVQEHGRMFLRASPSKSVRISLVAMQHGIDLTGVTFYGGSEPSTPAKVATIEASGAKFVTHYGASEAGTIGLACGNPAGVNDVHFMNNNLAMIQRPKTIFDQTVDAFHFTSLLATNPKMLINVQSDDFGIVEERDCGCPLYQMGFTKHIREISSFRKLTGEGVTLVGSDMIHILEHVLPAQFGGSLLDYQLVEEESSQGLTKLVLYVDPSVPLTDEAELLEAFLRAMKQSMPSARLAQAEYKTGEVVIVRRAKPFVTNRGKYFPIRTLNMSSK